MSTMQCGQEEVELFTMNTAEILSQNTRTRFLWNFSIQIKMPTTNAYSSRNPMLGSHSSMKLGGHCPKLHSLPYTHPKPKVLAADVSDVKEISVAETRPFRSMKGRNSEVDMSERKTSQTAQSSLNSCVRRT